MTSVASCGGGSRECLLPFLVQTFTGLRAQRISSRFVALGDAFEVAAVSTLVVNFSVSPSVSVEYLSRCLMTSQFSRAPLFDLVSLPSCGPNPFALHALAVELN